MNKGNSFSGLFQRGRYFTLLTSLLLLFIIYPFSSKYETGFSILDIFFLIILITGIYSISKNRSVFIAGSFLATVAFGAGILNIYLMSTGLQVVSKLFYMLFFGLSLTIILSNVIKAEKVTTDTILGAICAYILLGLAWTMVYSLLELLQPGSFHINEATTRMRDEFLYYSFVTMTTLGYGDITPISHPARSLSTLEAVTGQLYIAVLIAHLVGLRIVHSSSKK
jgi:hypothetical protein